jgi:hypothetical protein
MPGKQIAQWVLVMLTVGLTGCCHWCERHCSAQPPATCCQPMAYPQPVYQAQPAAYAAPACCPPQAAYPAPATYQQNYSPQWQRPVANYGSCCD